MYALHLHSPLTEQAGVRLYIWCAIYWRFMYKRLPCTVKANVRCFHVGGGFAVEKS
jgi:hypothetical protein